MGSIDFRSYFRIKSNLHWAVQKLFRQAPSLLRSSKSESPQALERIKALWSAVFLLMSSFVLGIWAYEMTQTESLLRWEKEHIPSTYIVQKSLQALGFHSISDLKIMTRLFRSLSLNADEVGGFWMSADHHWVAYYGRDPLQGDELSFQFYCLMSQNPSLPLNWLPLSRGWKGFEEVLLVLEKKAPSLGDQHSFVKIKKGKKQITRDPREIIY